MLLIRLIAVDIDGTLTFPDRKLDPSALEALRRAESSGIKVTLATGNVLSFAEAAVVLFGASGPLIAEDGGIIFDPATGRKEVLGNRVEADRGLAALEKSLGHLEQTRTSVERLAGLTLKRGPSLEKVREVLKKGGFHLVAVDSGFAIHIKSPEIDKANALRKISQSMDIPLDQIAAIGDGPNDVEMLKTAGLSFAVANAVEEVKRNSTFVTKAPHGKGVSEAIDEILSPRSSRRP